MSSIAKAIDQLEATTASVTAAAHTNEETKRDIADLFVTLRSQLDIHSGLPVDSPLRDGSEPETVTAQEAIDALEAADKPKKGKKA